MTTATTIQKHKYSRKEYLLKISNFIQRVHSARELYNEIYEMGRTLGYTDKQISQDFREVANKKGLTLRTVQRILPPEMKAKPRGATTPEKIKQRHDVANQKSSQEVTDDVNQVLNKVQSDEIQSQESEVDANVVLMDPKDFDINNLWDYAKGFLIDIIKYLHDENISLKENKGMANYDEAAKYATLMAQQQGITAERKWREHIKSSKFPENIPRRPDKFYEGKGWTSWNLFFGKQ